MGGSDLTGTTPVPVVRNQVYLMVLHVVFGTTNYVDLYIDPPSLGGAAPATPTISGSIVNEGFRFNRIRPYPDSGANGGSFDELRFGSSFAAVTPVASGVTYDLTLAVNPSGRATVSGAGTYDEGTVVNISVTNLDSAYKFINWTGTGIGDVADPNAAATTVTLNGHYSLTANLALKDFNDWSSDNGGGRGRR